MNKKATKTGKVFEENDIEDDIFTLIDNVGLYCPAYMENLLRVVKKARLGVAVEARCLANGATGERMKLAYQLVELCKKNGLVK